VRAKGEEGGVDLPRQCGGKGGGKTSKWKKPTGRVGSEGRKGIMGISRIWCLTSGRKEYKKEGKGGNSIVCGGKT